MSKNISILKECSKSLKASTDMLQLTLDNLDDATKDVPRLKIVLNTEKVFGVVPELDLENAKINLQNKIHPQINFMISKIENELAKLRRRKANLASKADLQKVRLDSAIKSYNDLHKNSNNKTISTAQIAKYNIPEAKLAKLKFLQDKKSRLKFSLSRFKIQDQQAKLGQTVSLPPPN